MRRLARLAALAAVAASAPAAIVHTVPGQCRSALWGVRVDGAECGVASARTCDEPFGGWGFYQGGEYAFASFEMGAPATLEVRALKPRDLSRVKVLPEGLPVAVRQTAPDTLEVAVGRPCRFSLEPDGREGPLLVFAEPPMANVPDEGDPKVKTFGPGWHDAGRIELGDGETLFLKPGAFVKGGVFAKGDNIRICGYGVLDGTDYPWRKGPVPHVIQLKECRNATVDGLVVRGAYHWTIVPIGCDGVAVRGVKLCGGRVQNDDGLDPCNSRNVLAEDCFFRTDDDCVAVKGTSWGEKYGGVENVAVRNCTFWSDHARIALMGHESRTPFMRGVVFEDCDFLRSRLSAFLLEPGEGMRLENVRASGIRVRDDIGDPAYRTVTIRPCVNEYMGRKVPGHVAGVRFENVVVTCPPQTNSLVLVSGFDPEHRVQDITFADCAINGQPLTQDLPGVEIGKIVDGLRFLPSCGGSVGVSTATTGATPPERFDNPRENIYN